MKIEHLLVQHFYQQREITLQGLGTFTLDPGFVVPAENDKDIEMPDQAIRFQYNPKATEDPELISYIVQQTRKIRPLASADLDSYLVLGKQFLNIGKPFIIEGLGVLEKSQQGDYEFRQGFFHQSKTEGIQPELKEKAEDDISFAAKRPKRPSGRKPLLIIISILLIVLVASSVWYYLHQKKEAVTDEANTGSTTQPVIPVPDTQNIHKPVTDSLARDSASKAAGPQYTFKVVFREYLGMDAAVKKMKDLIQRKHVVIMFTSDSLHYKLAEPFTLPLSDTARIRDSLNKFYYNGKAYLEY